MGELKRYDVLSRSVGGTDEVASKSGEYVRAVDAMARETELEREVSALKQRLRRSKAAKDQVYEIGQAQTQKAKRRNAELVELLRIMAADYACCLTAGHDRITQLGGDCDSVQKMLSDNPNYAKAIAALGKPVEPEESAS